MDVIRDLKYSKCVKYCVCAYVMVTNMIVNVDHGALPAALIEVSQDVKLTNE